MSPDINSLPPSRSASASPRQPRNISALSDTLSSQHSSSQSGLSPAVSANMNNNNQSQAIATELPRRPHIPIPGSERRRSTNLNLNNSHSESIAGDIPLSTSDHRASLSHGLRTSSPSSLGGSPIIATGDPHHQRTPSLGELHQELEQEQEAQVNRLLQTIRAQQTQLQHLQQQQQQPQQSAVEDIPSERSNAFPPIAPTPTVSNRPSTQLPSSLSSRRPSQTHSPNLRPLPDPARGPEPLEWAAGHGESISRRGSRDESGYYQAEAAMLARENQMLRQRIRELERQVSELTTNSSSQGQGVRAPPPPQASSSLSAPTTTGVGSASESSDKT